MLALLDLLDNSSILPIAMILFVNDFQQFLNYYIGNLKVFPVLINFSFHKTLKITNCSKIVYNCLSLALHYLTRIFNRPPCIRQFGC